MLVRFLPLSATQSTSSFECRTDRNVSTRMASRSPQMRVAVLVTQARSSLPGGSPWVELPRLLVSSFQFSLDIYFLPSRRTIVGNVPRFDRFDRVYKRLF